MAAASPQLHIPLEIYRMVAKDVSQNESDDLLRKKTLMDLRLVSQSFAQAGDEQLFDRLKIRTGRDPGRIISICNSRLASHVKAIENIVDTSQHINLGTSAYSVRPPNFGIEKYRDMCRQFRTVDLTQALRNCTNAEDLIFRVFMISRPFDEVALELCSSIMAIRPNWRSIQIFGPDPLIGRLSRMPAGDNARNLTLKSVSVNTGFRYLEPFHPGTKNWETLTITRNESDISSSPLGGIRNLNDVLCPRLRQLEIVGLWIESSGLTPLVTSARASLQTVRLVGLYFWESSTTSILRSLELCSNLQRLELVDCGKFLEDDHTVSISLPPLRELVIKHATVGQRMMLALLARSQHIITTLILHDTEIQPIRGEIDELSPNALGEALVDALIGCSKLTELNLCLVAAESYFDQSKFHRAYMTMTMYEKVKHSWASCPVYCECHKFASGPHELRYAAICVDTIRYRHKMGALVRQVRSRRDDWGGEYPWTQFVPCATWFASLYPWEDIQSGRAKPSDFYMWFPWTCSRVR